ncbi:MAG: HD domain-containing phosphohydrolase [Myxococcota bacterium]
MVPPEIGSFATVRRWLLAQDEGRFGRVRLDPSGNVMLERPRSRVVVLPPGAELPDRFDVLLLAGPANILAQALVELDTPRVQLLALPTPTVVADRVVAEAVRTADAVAGARLADQLVEIGTALSAERDPARVLEMILHNGRSIARADAGSMFLVEKGGAQLRVAAAHNDSVDVDFTEVTVPVTPGSIVGTAVMTGRTVRVGDLYESGNSITHGRTFTHDRSYDEQLGYQTRSMLTTPVITPEGRVLAVMQLINARTDDLGPLQSPVDFSTRVRAFTDEDERLCTSLASQAAVALENAQLYADIQALFEGFVRASVHAIEQRDPTTSGHSQRVADLTVGLARAANAHASGPFGGIQFGEAELREIEYAGLLHDFGKVGVREEVLVKAKKLYPHQLAMVNERFAHMRTALQVELLQAKLDGVEPDAVRQRMADLERSVKLVHQSNEPTVLPKAASEQLGELLSLSFFDAQGRHVRVVEPEEVDALRIPRGTLTASERREIEDHVRHTYDFLVRIPWTASLSRIPEIAGKHHEYLDGSGYPSALGEPEIPIQARMMTVADIFDALTAADRPYKQAVPLDRALDILHAEAKRGKVDPDVLALFIDASLWQTSTP